MSARSEARASARELWETSGGKISLKEIADRLGVPANKVRKWKSLDKWNAPLERSTSSGGTLHSEEVERSTPKKPGAHPGNKNALGNKGGKGGPAGNRHAAGHGAPPRNQNAVKTGEYATLWEDTLTDEERTYYAGIDDDPLIQINKTIKDLSLREFRMMRLLQELKGQRQTPIVADEKSDLADDVTRIVEERKGLDKNNGTNRQIIVNRKLMEKILAVEEALTRVQEGKRKALETKQKILRDRESREDFSQELCITIVDKEAGEEK